MTKSGVFFAFNYSYELYSVKKNPDLAMYSAKKNPDFVWALVDVSDHFQWVPVT